MPKTALQQMIELWEGISKLHNEAMFIAPADPEGYHVFAKDFRRQSALRDEADAVLHALRTYNADLEDGQ